MQRGEKSKMIKICCITYKDLDDLVRRAISELVDTEIELTIITGLREEIIEKMKQKISEGTEVFIAGGANAEIAEENFSGPIVRYKISDFDYLAAVAKGFQEGRRPAIVTYRTGISEKLKGYLNTQKKEILNIVYEDTQDLEEAIVREEADVVIGHAHPVEVGKYLNRKTISIYPGIQSIIDTVYDAKLLAKEIRKVKEENQYKNTILNYMPSGVILIDEQERIVELR